VPCDIYLDDSPEQLTRYLAKRPESLICRYVRPWNDPIESVQDVQNWGEFVDLAKAQSALR